MKYLIILLLTVFWASCGTDSQTGCESSSDCRFGRQCVQNICIGDVGDNNGQTGNNGQTQNNGQTLNNGQTQNNGLTLNNQTSSDKCIGYYDCPADQICPSNEFELLECINADDAVLVDSQVGPEGCQFSWRWENDGGGTAGFACDFSSNVNAIPCECEARGRETRTKTFTLNRRGACSNPVFIENSINGFCGTRIRNTLDWL